MSERIPKVNELVGHILSRLFERDLSLKSGVLATITRVDTTRDLRYTRVFVSVFPETEAHYTLQTLIHERRNLQKKLHAELTMKIKPRLEFSLDQTEVAAEEVEHLLKKIAEESHFE